MTGMARALRLGDVELDRSPVAVGGYRVVHHFLARTVRLNSLKIGSLLSTLLWNRFPLSKVRIPGLVSLRSEVGGLTGSVLADH